MTDPAPAVVQVATLGAAYSANKGAGAMLEAMVQGLPSHVGPCRVVAVSTHARDDEPELARAGLPVEVASQTPVELAFVHLPLALLGGALRRLGLPWRWLLRPRALRALADADVVVDISGISFVDGRRVPVTIYNSLVVLVPLLLGSPVVKAAQAMGPFRRPLNRVLARLVLPRLAAVCPRGAASHRHLVELGLSRVVPAQDLAFTLAVDEAVRARMQERLAGFGEGPLLVVAPSQVVDTSCRAQGIDYETLVVDLVDALVERGDHRVVLLAHSAQPGAGVTHMNDLPLCRAVHGRLARPDRVQFFDESLLPAELRAVIGEADVLVTSRFHAMIAALAEGTPLLVVGWSHKYAEILETFGLEDQAMTYTELSTADAVLARLDGTLVRSDEIRERIAAHLDAAVASAAASFEPIATVVRGEAAAHGALPTAQPVAIRTNRATRTQDLQGVIDAHMCIGCGACTFADPTVELVLDPVKLIYQPSHASNAAAAAVCPAVQVDFAGLQERRFPGAEQTPFGVVRSVLLAQSTDEGRNRRASSGGLVKELLLHHLRSGEVDGVLALGHVEGLDFQTQLVTDPDDVDRLPGSIYHNLGQTRMLELLHELEGRYVVVAIPCQLEGIWSYIDAQAPHLAEKIHSTIGLLCGWQYSHHALRAIAEFKGVDFDAITDISYRGEGPVGRLRMWTGEQVHAVGRRVDFDYQVAFDRSFNTPRCHVCVNHSNYLADIVVGDAWLPSTVASQTGVSLLVCRSEKAERAVAELRARDRVKVVEVSTAEILESQRRRVVFGDFAYAYAAYLDDLGVHHPDMVGPNRPEAQLVDRDAVAHFHKELQRKLALQWASRYRFLRVRKATVELPTHVSRYLDWFLVRVVRIKSLTGKRKEVPRAQLRDFR